MPQFLAVQTPHRRGCVETGIPRSLTMRSEREVKMGEEAPRQSVLRDGLVRLRPFEGQADVTRAVPWYSDPEVLYFSEGPHETAFDRERVARMYDHLAALGELYMTEVETPSGWRVIGDATLAPETVPIVIGEKEWRHRGVGSRVLGLLVERARELGYSFVGVRHVWRYNVASQRLFERAGFRLVESGTDAQGREFLRYSLTLSPK